jgi:hypothetical protein
MPHARINRWVSGAAENLLEAVSCAEQRCFCARLADDLDTNRQSFGGESTWQT